MKVKMLTRYAGPSGTCQPGKIINLPEKEAKSLISGGYALSVAAKVKPTPDSDPPDGDPGDREAEILDAVDILVDENDKSKLIASGAPSVEALEDLLGYDITSAERDTAYEQVR